ncbi:hypothetical protein [Shewanella sp.]|uniref:hypothetical protein n=1 Tax=Shewanella sp. TaxID=50422 RepID=UPI003D0EEA0D
MSNKGEVEWRCRRCGEVVNPTDFDCPHCNFPLRKKPGYGLFILGLICSVIISFVLTRPQDSSATSTNSIETVAVQEKTLESYMPKEQIEFIKMINAYKAGFNNTKNELQESILRDKRKNALSELFRKLSVNSWVGTITDLSTDTDGNASLTIKIADNIAIKTWNNSFSDQDYGSMVSKNSYVFNNLFNLSEGDKVVFSGRFYKSDRDGIDESSLTIAGSMTDPEFIFKFKDVRPIN